VTPWRSLVVRDRSLLPTWVKLWGEGAVRKGHAMRARTWGVLAAFCVLAAASASPQQPITENTVRLANGAASPPAAITDMAWLAGHWTGEGLGGQVEEIWSPPQAGAMMGMFRLVHDGTTSFYELMTLVEGGGSLVLRVKHFGPDLTGWEEKAETVDFALAAAAGDRYYFDGLTFHRHGNDATTIYVRISSKDGAVREEAFRYTRVGGERRPAE